MLSFASRLVPAKALDEEGKTDVRKCLRIRPAVRGRRGYPLFLQLREPKEEQLKMIRDALFLGPVPGVTAWSASYNCFKCVAACPVGK